MPRRFVKPQAPREIKYPIASLFPDTSERLLFALAAFVCPNSIWSEYDLKGIAANTGLSRKVMAQYREDRSLVPNDIVNSTPVFERAILRDRRPYGVHVRLSREDFKTIITTLTPRHVVEILEKIPKTTDREFPPTRYAVIADFLLRLIRCFGGPFAPEDEAQLSQDDQQRVRNAHEVGAQPNFLNTADTDEEEYEVLQCRQEIAELLVPYCFALAFDPDLVRGLKALRPLEAQAFAEYVWLPDNELLPSEAWQALEQTTREMVEAGAGVWKELHDEAVYHGVLYSGHPQEAAQRLYVPEGRAGLLLAAMQEMLAGRNQQAVKRMRAALKLECARNRSSRRLFLGSFENFLFGLALYNDKASGMSKRSLTAFAKMDGLLSDYNAGLPLFAGLGLLVDCGRYAAAYNFKLFHESDKPRKRRSDSDWFFYYDDEEPTDILTPRVGLNRALFAIVSINFHLFSPTSTELATIREDIKGSALLEHLLELALDPASAASRALGEKLGMANLLPSVRVTEKWELALERILEASAKTKSKAAKKAALQERVAYLVDVDALSYTQCMQRSKDGVNWSFGRKIALKTFAAGDVACMTDQDRRAAKCTSISTNRWWPSSLSGFGVTRELIGHPAVYDDKNGGKTRIQIVSQPLRIEVKDTSKGFAVTTNIDEQLKENPFASLFVDTSEPGMIGVTEITPEQQVLLANLNEIRSLPKAAREPLTEVLKAVSGQAIVASSLLAESGVLARQQADTCITLQMRNSKEVKNAFEATAVVHPVEGARVTCEPGRGLATLTVATAGGDVQVERNLKVEKRNFQTLLGALSDFDDCRTQAGHWELETARCLDMLLAIRENTALAGIVKLEWPEGEKLRVAHASAGFGNLKLSVHRMGQWLELDGALMIDSAAKLKIGEVLGKLDEARGNFIALGEHEYLALTAALKKQLEMLKDVAEGTARKQKVSAFNGGFN